MSVLKTLIISVIFFTAAGPSAMNLSGCKCFPTFNTSHLAKFLLLYEFNYGIGFLSASLMYFFIKYSVNAFSLRYFNFYFTSFTSCSISICDYKSLAINFFDALVIAIFKSQFSCFASLNHYQLETPKSLPIRAAFMNSVQ